MSTAVASTLRELHRLRRHLRDLQTEIDQGPRVLKMQRDQLAAEEQGHKDAHETIKRLKLKQKDDEITLKQTEDNLAKFQAQLNSAGSTKEFRAKESEIAQASAKKGEYEDAILTTITEIEERTADLPNVERRWADAQKLFQQYEADAKERMERILADQTASQAQLADWEAKIPPEVKGPYDRLVKKHGPDGLAAVVGRTCQQCRTSITEQQKNSLLAGAFVCCSHCGRGLYLAESSA